MAREKYQSLTEQMFYILLTLEQECCGVDIMKQVAEITAGRVQIGAGTLYSLLDNFVKEGFICETKVENRKKSYIITDVGKARLSQECQRLQTLLADFNKVQSEIL